MSQHYWPSICKPRPNHRTFQRNIVGPVFASPGQPSQHFNATLLAQHLQVPAKRSQHLNATLLGVTCCARLATLLQRIVTCWELLAQIWKWSNFELTTTNMSQQGVQTRTNSAATCCVEMLRSFGRGFISFDLKVNIPGFLYNFKVSLSLHK